jgi:hypothetical protein
MSSHRLIEITDEVRAEVSGPELDQKDMEYCVLSSQTELRAVVASNPKLPAKFAQWMAKDIEPTVREALSQNQSIDPKIIDELSQDSNLAVISAAAFNPNLKPERLSELANHRSYIVRNEVARNSKAPLAVLERLAQDTEWGVRRSVASNLNVTKELLNQLSTEDIPEIQLAVAANPATAMDTLTNLWNTFPSTRRTVVENPSCIEEFLLEAIDDALKLQPDQEESWDDDLKGDTNIREAIAQRTNLTRALIQKLINDPSHYVRRYVASNILLTESDLSVLALDSDENVRQAVVENPNTSNESKAAATLLGLPERDSDDE